MSAPERPGTAVNAQTLGEFGAQTVNDLRVGFHRATHPMLIADSQRRWVTANIAACELLGIAPTEVAWRSLDEFTRPSALGRLEAQWAAFLTSGAAEGWYQLHVPHGGSVAVEFSAVAHVQQGRHLLLFMAPHEFSMAQERSSVARGDAWAPVPTGAGDRAQLTNREREVISLIAAGGQGGDIAGRLFLSPETVKSHVQNAMAKLGAHTRAHAVAIALVTGQIIWSMYDETAPVSSLPEPLAPR
jgi:DNA-binding CsgD family transcriptional regulator